jgi:phosphate starvation-inducible protein PhoH
MTMAEDSKDTEGTGGAAKAGGGKGRARKDAAAAKATAAPGAGEVDFAALQVELHRAQLARMRSAHELCGHANAELGALRAEVNGRLAARGEALRAKMQDAWQRVQECQMALWQVSNGGGEVAAASGEATADLVRAQAEVQALHATLCNLAVLDPDASEAYVDGLAREAEIRSAFEREMAEIDSRHTDDLTTLIDEAGDGDLAPQMRMQLDTLKGWYGIAGR